MDENSDSEDDEPDDAFLMMQTEADAQCHGDEETDGEIIESARKWHKLETEKEEESEDEDEKEELKLWGSEAQQALDILSRLAIQSKFDEKTLYIMNYVGSVVDVQTLLSKRQATITGFFPSK